MTESESCVPVLTYHSLDSTGSVISTTPEKFRRQMQVLAKSSLRVLSLREIADCLREKRTLPARSVALTFDDGFQNVHDVAFPVLSEYGFPATVFLVTEFCGKDNNWYGQAARIPRLDLLNWEQIEDMAKGGMEFGVHTATHPDLTKISAAKVSGEILEAKEMIQKRLGTTSMAFAYPYGKYSAAAGEIVKSTFYAACSTEMDFVIEQSDLHFLPRIDMFYFSTNDLFSSIGTRSFRRFVHLRKALRGLKRMIVAG